MKHSNMSIPNDNYSIPAKPESFRQIEDKIDVSDRLQSTLYKNIRKNPFLHNIASANPILAKFHFYQLLHNLYRTAAAGTTIDKYTLEDLEVDEFKYWPIFG